MGPHPQTWLKTTPFGLYCEPGDFYIDPLRPVPRAVISHAHADHARPGHAAVLATQGTLAIMRTRMGAERAGGTTQALAYNQPIKLGDVRVTLHPAGHVVQNERAIPVGEPQPVGALIRRQPAFTCCGRGQ